MTDALARIARRNVARSQATVMWAMLPSGREYDPTLLSRCSPGKLTRSSIRGHNGPRGRAVPVEATMNARAAGVLPEMIRLSVGLGGR